MLKRILLTLVFATIASFQAEASHILGGDIQYKYVGDSTGVSGQYRVKLVIYRESTGIGLGNTQTVTINAPSCNLSTSVTCTRIVPEFSAGQLGAYDCISNTNSVFTPMVNIYIGYVVLTQTCNDYKMYWQSCCRPGGITGITNSAGVGFYYEAELNNTLGNNSSPVFVSIPLSYICTGSFINYLQNAYEFDGDSINYELIPAREFNWGVGGASVPYAAGYTATAPITTSPTAPFTLDAQSGNISFIATQAETSVIAIRVNEYRYDSTYFYWEKVGSSNREIQVSVASNCNPIVNDGVKLDPNAPGVTMDAQGRQVRQYNCLDSTVMLHFTLAVECISIAPDASDFRLTAPNGQPIPIEELVPFCDVNGETDSLLVKLFKPLAMNGDYFLYSKVGNDGNTLLNKCGKDMDEFDTIILQVSDCVDWEMEITNVTIDEDQSPHVYWEVDSTAFANYSFLFNTFDLYRSDDGGASYNHVFNSNDPNLRDFYDWNVSGAMVDAQSFRYFLEATVNGQKQPQSTRGNSIWLRGDISDPSNMSLQWSDYRTWNNAQYQMMFGRNLSGIPSDYTWTEYGALTTDTLGNMSQPNLGPGQFAIKIRSVNQNSIADTAYSNWIEFGQPVPPIPPVDTLRIPNVISPNGDGRNDAFIIDGIMTYNDERKVTIRNRNGKIVYQTEMYDNSDPFTGRDSRGNVLADGVYFYVIEVWDNNNAYGVKEAGNLTILSK